MVLYGIVHGIANFSPFFTMPENMKGSKSEKLEVVKARSRKARRKELEVGELSVKQLKVVKLGEEELNEGKARSRISWMKES